MHLNLRYALLVVLALGALIPAPSIAKTTASEHIAMLKTFAPPTKINHPGDDPANGDGAPYDIFGGDVAISGDTALIGVSGDDTLAGSNAGSAYVYVRSGGVWTRQAKLTPPDAGSGDSFGSAVALVGDLAVVSAPYNDTATANDSGSVYVYQRNGAVWQLQAQLTATMPQTDAGFGAAIDFDGSVLIVGAPYENLPGADNAGAVYLFDHNAGAWSAATRLDAFGTGSTNDFFGHSVAVHADMAVVGVPFDDTPSGVDSGRVYTFRRNAGTWNVFHGIDANDAAPGDFFGTSLAISATTLAIGARWDDTAAGGNAGSVYVFLRGANSYAFQAKITAFDAAAGDYFGTSLALQADTLLIGAPYDNDASFADVGCGYAYVRNAGVWTPTHKFVASGGQALDQLGTSVAMDNGTALFGAISDDVAGILDVGSVVAFTAPSGSWSQQARLSPGGSASGDDFGSAVAIAGDLAVVGAPGEDTAAGSNAGVAYVYQRSSGSWQLQTTLQANDGIDNARFGVALAISGNSVIVGANGGSGAAYVFIAQSGNWSLQSKLTRADSIAGDNFGLSVAINADTAAIAAPNDDTAQGQSTGSVTIFSRSGGFWSQQGLLVATDADEFDRFGQSIALDGDRALIGASYDEGAAGAFSGSAYVFQRDAGAWSQQVKLIAADAAASDQFGSSVALSGDTALVGALGDDPFGNPDQGSVYVFGFGNAQWTQQGKLFAADGESGDYFGSTLAVDGDQAVIGAGGDDSAGIADVGGAYVFVRSNAQWQQDSKLTVPDVQANLSVARGVAISGATALVGAPGDGGDQSGNSGVGSIYLFLRALNVTPLAGAHGAVSPAGVQNVAFGASVAFTLLPDPGYGVASVSGCAGTLANNVFTTATITQNCLLNVSFANTAPAIAVVADQPIAEDAATQMLTITLSDAETAAANLSLSASSNQPALIPSPLVSASSQPDQRTLTFAPTSNANGGPVTITLTVDDGFGQSAQRSFSVSVAARNDAPTFTFAALPGYVAGSSGPRNVPNFASFDAGPDDEDASQGVDDYLIDGVLDDGGVLVPGSVDIGNDGTLNFTLTGIGGSAYVNARVRDNGANGSGDQNVSASKQFVISVAPSADLQVAIDNQRGGVQDGEGVLYTLLVANAGPNTIGGARLLSTHSTSLVNVMWACNEAASSAACPGESSGNGDLMLEIELAAGEFLQFDLAADVDGNAGAFITQTATVEPPADYAEINGSNNSASDQDPIVGLGIFTDGFEQTGMQTLSLPAAAAAISPR